MQRQQIQSNVALDIGPIGQLMAPLGTLSFEEAYDIFKEQLVAGEKAGADLVIFETFSDLMELKVGYSRCKRKIQIFQYLRLMTLSG